VDLNDVFDDIALAENTSFDEGFREGVNRSRAQGFAEGFGLGLGKGLQIGVTVGFYRQFARLHLSWLEKAEEEEKRQTTTTATTTTTGLDSAPQTGALVVEDDAVSGTTTTIPAQNVVERSKRLPSPLHFTPARREKLTASLKALLRSIEEFDLNDCENEDLFKQLETIESKYKRVKALLSLKIASAGGDAIDGLKNSNSAKATGATDFTF